jgi:hypothetical protein
VVRTFDHVEIAGHTGFGQMATLLPLSFMPETPFTFPASPLGLYQPAIIAA